MLLTASIADRAAVRRQIVVFATLTVTVIVVTVDDTCHNLSRSLPSTLVKFHDVRFCLLDFGF